VCFLGQSPIEMVPGVDKPPVGEGLGKISELPGIVVPADR